MSLLRTYIREVLEEEQEEIGPVIHPSTQIFCDMDGVLVNFEDRIVSLLNDLLDGGELPGGVEKSRRYFDFLRRIQADPQDGGLGKDWRPESRDSLDIKVVRNFMFRAIGANPGPIFASMQPHPDAMRQLWPFLNATGHTVNLLTAPINTNWESEDNPNVQSAAEGKIAWAEKWLNKELGMSPAEIIVTPARQKKENAVINGVPNILIDDRAATVDAWNDETEAAGFGRGYGILHQPRNSAATVQKLRELGL